MTFSLAGTVLALLADANCNMPNPVKTLPNNCRRVVFIALLSS
jgi:hypothetical protein